jgi:hypothetical protein
MKKGTVVRIMRELELIAGGEHPVLGAYTTPSDFIEIWIPGSGTWEFSPTDKTISHIRTIDGCNISYADSQTHFVDTMPDDWPWDRIASAMAGRLEDIKSELAKEALRAMLFLENTLKELREEDEFPS